LKTLYRNIILGVLLAAFLAAGFYMGYKKQFFEPKEKESAEVMLEKISKVFKMVAVEGYVSEMYDYEAYRYWDVSFLRKKAFVRVKAKVSVGYDFENANFVVNETIRTITIKPFPKAKILSIDHDLDYYDLQEGVFNEFSKDDLNRINQRAKDYTVSQIEQGPLFEQAEEQKQEIINLLSELFSKTGWTLISDDNHPRFKG